MLFILDVATDPASRRATLRLADGEGRHLAAHEVELDKHPPAQWEAAFDTQAHLRRMKRRAPAEQQLAELGAFLGTEVLGAEIAGRLASGVGPRTLLVRVPDAPEDRVAAGFASIPWDFVRTQGDELTLLQRNVTVRVAFTGAEPGKGIIVTPPRGEAVRVLLVFADPPGAEPLGARLERERLREMFFGEILPKRDVEVDVLCHGVTRARLQERITERAGYHVVHWSGHGNVNALGLADGWLTGEELVALFRDAGGMVPAVMMLGACHSGAVVAPKDWASLRAEESEKGGGAGLAGTALALVRAGVKQVAAMRWAVGDVYARRLAKRFYRHLLADDARYEVDKAVALARGELLRDEARKGEYDAVDHATPLVLGAEGVRFAAEKKSNQTGRRAPRPQPLLSGSRELDPPWGFVGRGEEITRLFGEWIGGQAEKPVALIQGLAGLGKTSLAAEVVNLGYGGFDYVLAFQAKGTALGIEELYRRIDQRLAQASPAYRGQCQENERARVFLESEPGFQGSERYETLAYNLVDAMDLLIDRLVPEARRLLWMVTRAGEPVYAEMIETVWGSSPARLLGELCGTGLLARENTTYAFHELVAERATDWMAQHPTERGDKTAAEVWTAYGEWYGTDFWKHMRSGKRGSRDVAVEMGRRGIRYLVRARAFESLASFASWVVTSTHDPALLGQVIADLQTAAAKAPAGRARWSLRTNLADALNSAGRPDQALPLYAQATEEAEAAANWPDVGWICQNWANALGDVGQLDRAHETYLRSADAERRGGDPRVLVVGSELEALRVDVKQGRAAEALPAIDENLAELRAWWARRNRGEPVPETPDDEILARTLVSSLDVARQANDVLERWQPCLDLLGEIEQVQRAIGTGEHEIAGTRFNRYGPLRELGRLDEARTVLEGCLEIYRRLGDVTGEAKALSALASVWDALGDPRQALDLELQALALRERLPDPADRATSHNNLAIYLHATGSPDEARAHQLADLVYTLVTGRDLRISLNHLANRIRESATRGERFALPALPTLLADPAFAPLRAFLTERTADIPALQARIDQLVEEARANP